ncbi:thrombospondin-2-like [Branchiostoma floridae x Branchiostoma belcheri]
MAGWCLLGGALAAMLMIISGATAAFNPALDAFSRAVALDRTLVDIPHRLLCHELCLKDASCASFQYNPTSRECRISIAADGLEDRPGDGVDDSLHDLSLDGLLPAASDADTRPDCTSEPDACIIGDVCQETCAHDGAMTCSCRSRTWDRGGCRSVDVGSWEEWQPWGDCSATCGGGVKTRTRTCSDQYGGNTCVGRSTETRACAETPCPVWSEWSGWTKCRRCGKSRTRTRTCPSPGKCHGDPEEKSACMGSTECNTHVRLQRGLYVTDGWVEVWDQLNGYWRPLCGEWNQQNGRVACRHVGFKDAEEATPLDIMSLGCFNDTPSDKSPEEETWNTTLNGPSMTSSSPAECLAFCRLRGFKYAAIRSE